MSYFFFFKQKTAYEMRISDWSSDVCSSDLPDVERLREEIREFFAKNLPAELSRKTLNGQKVSKADHQAWQRVLAARGWLAPSWSKHWGGPGWGPLERFIYDEESAPAGAPRATIPTNDWTGPVTHPYRNEE